MIVLSDDQMLCVLQAAANCKPFNRERFMRLLSEELRKLDSTKERSDT